MTRLTAGAHRVHIHVLQARARWSTRGRAPVARIGDLVDRVDDRVLVVGLGDEPAAISRTVAFAGALWAADAGRTNLAI